MTLRAATLSGSATDRVSAALKRAGEVEPKIHAFTQVFEERALACTSQPQSEGAGSRALAGIPIAIKDNLCLSWGKTTCASNILRNYESPYTATAVQKLIDAGAVIIGKTNLDEFAMGSSTEHSCFGPTFNPWDISRVPGGSSGGSAAAVAAGIVPLALGSDTGGSVRQPASHCGIVGVKPTYGRISRYGLVAYASSLDQIGTLTRTVEDAALALSVICGHDPLDTTSSQEPMPDLLASLDTPVDSLRLAVPRQARSDANHPEVARVFEETIATYKKLGATIVDVELPLLDHGIAAYYIVAPAEASSNLARFDGIRYGHRAKLAPGEDLFDLYCKTRSEGFGPEVQRRIMLGTHVLSSGYYDAYYNTALKVRRKIKQDFDRVFADCHAVLMPASPSPAFKVGEKTSDPLAMYLEDVYTVTINLAGLPAMSIPAGFASVEGKQLPVGVQIVSPAFDEARMLRIAQQFERATDWHARKPLI
ncbi:MAG: Asp-tRNA(Asn)/Glu-tRNA(Gln) amidotransferase subunit GatA [Phycisphaeraceae bacterium]|nr:Asp-tRNA(Asn)/Glu-tRNA(Gln) amidotransferase subunit GatA [Phycisphaeraceae bacterium]